MLTYKLIKEENGIYTYEYYPEGKTNNIGIVKLNKNGKHTVIKQADDVGDMYLIHALNHIEIGKISGTVAWY